MDRRTSVMPLLLCAILGACAAPAPGAAGPPAATLTDTAGNPSEALEMNRRLSALLPTDVLLLGEQHDAPAHQQLQRAVVQALAGRGTLAALALEMAEQGASTAGLPPGAGEAQVRDALRWSDAAWPWNLYGPMVMAAARAGVPVLGANLPRAQMKDAMKNIALDDHPTPGKWQKQQELIREGHCGLLPDTQILPMTRVQTARDAAMARTVLAARQPGKTVLLIAGNGHVDRELGVPTHLGREVNSQSIMLSTDPDPATPGATPAASAVWTTPAPPPKDYCADMRRQMAPAR